MSEEKKMTTPELFKLLENKYCGNDYAFFGNVASATGYGIARTADAVAMGLWPSRGLNFEGFELKVSRSDYLHELKQPEKAEEICQFCDKWWLVVSDEKIIQNDLPDNWGLIAPRRGKLVVIKQAPKLKCKPLDREFIASLFRKFSETYIPKSSIREEIRLANENAEKRAESHVGYALAEYKMLKETVEKFEKSSGVEISRSWIIEEIGTAVKMVMEGRHLRSLESLKRIRDDIEETLKNNS